MPNLHLNNGWRGLVPSMNETVASASSRAALVVGYIRSSVQLDLSCVGRTEPVYSLYCRCNFHIIQTKICFVVISAAWNRNYFQYGLYIYIYRVSDLHNALWLVYEHELFERTRRIS